MQQEEKKGQGGSQKHNEGASVYKKRIPSTHICLPEGASASYAEGTNHEEGHAEGISNNLRERTSQESVNKKQTELDKEARKPESPNHEDDHAEGISINLKERLSQGSVDKKQIESDKEARQLEIGNNLVSEAVTKNTLFLEKLSRYLDLERRYISCWRHLAYALKVPTEETQKFDIYTEHSPTEDLLNFLEGNHPDLYVKELKEKLHNVYRNDVIEALQKDGYTVGSRVRDLVLKKPKFTALLSSMLDKESRGNWKSLANEFGIEKQKSDQFGLLGCGPTGALFLHIQTDEKLRYLTMGQLRGHFCEMELKKLVSLLEEGDSRLVRDVAPIGSNLLAEICKHLNVEARYVKNWSNLANKLGIPPEVYAAFDTSKAKAKSPTKEMFKCLAQLYPNLVVSDLLAALKKIERFDVVDLVREETNGEFKMKDP